jgi:hypothetical protein
MNRFLLLLASIAAGLVCAPSALAAARPVTIVLYLHHGAGRFTLSGALSDRGSVAGRRPALAVRRGRGAETLTLEGRAGTITIAFVGAGAMADADWAIRSASGAYRGLRGSGVIASRRVVPGAIREVLRGSITSR